MGIALPKARAAVALPSQATPIALNWRALALDRRHDENRAAALFEQLPGEIVENGARPGSGWPMTEKAKARAKAAT